MSDDFGAFLPRAFRSDRVVNAVKVMVVSVTEGCGAESLGAGVTAGPTAGFPKGSSVTVASAKTVLVKSKPSSPPSSFEAQYPWPVSIV
jgi:hypothetical protein